jgi:hypothetical protein
MRIGLVLLSLLVTASTTQAQTCIGKPFGAGSISIGGGAAFSDGSKGFAIGVNGYDRSRVLWGASIGLTDFDDIDKNATDIGASLGFVAASSNQFTVCPVVTGGYSWWADSDVGVDVDISALYGSAGIGLGVDVPLESGPVLGLFAWPALIFQRTSLEASGPGGTFEESETDNAFGATLGIGLGFSRAYLTGLGSFSSVEDSDPGFGIMLGFNIR